MLTLVVDRMYGIMLPIYTYSISGRDDMGKGYDYLRQKHTAEVPHATRG